jgi:hypothetical protein
MTVVRTLERTARPMWEAVEERVAVGGGKRARASRAATCGGDRATTASTVRLSVLNF